MKSKSREELCELMKAQYMSKMGSSISLTGERMCIINNLDRLHHLVQIDMIPRTAQTPITKQPDERQKLLGRFRDPEQDKKCITNDLDIIKFFAETLHEDPPSFVEAGPRRNLYYDPASVKVGILTSGGIAPGLNTVVESIVQKHVGTYELKLTPHSSGGILGFSNGFAGLEEDRYEVLTPERVQGWCRLGASKLGMGRGKTDVGRWMNTIRKNGLDILYVIGGNGSLTGARELANALGAAKMNVSVGAVPKTMDNDILWVWQSFGFQTAFDKATEIVNILHTEAEATGRVCVLQLFGAKSGHVAANAALASGDVDAVLIPEEPADIEKICKHIVQRVARNQHAMVVMAEAATIVEKGTQWLSDTREQRDSNFRRICETIDEALNAAKLGKRVFANQPQHVIRSVPPSAHDQVYCRRLADMVVDSCLGGYTNFMISSWLTQYCLVPLLFAARGGLTDQGNKTFPVGGIFWRTVRTATGQPSFKPS